MGDRAGEGRAYGSLGNVCQSLGDFSQAIEHHARDLAIAKEVGDRAGEGRTGASGMFASRWGTLIQRSKHTACVWMRGTKPGFPRAKVQLRCSCAPGNPELAVAVRLFNVLLNRG